MVPVTALSWQRPLVFSLGDQGLPMSGGQAGVVADLLT